MRERPILFSAPMVLAILNGTKTQTRRLNKYEGRGLPGLKQPWQCPYGMPGDRLWVRETFVIEGDDNYPMEESQYPRDGRPVNAGDEDNYGWQVPWYRATDGEPNIVPPDLEDSSDDRTRWKPSIFMPRWASRITLEVIDARVERLQEISESDCCAEGVGSPITRDLKQPKFRALWDSINGKRKGAAWDDNPWLWVVNFKRIKP